MQTLKARLSSNCRSISLRAAISGTLGYMKDTDCPVMWLKNPGSLITSKVGDSLYQWVVVWDTDPTRLGLTVEVEPNSVLPLHKIPTANLSKKVKYESAFFTFLSEYVVTLPTRGRTAAPRNNRRITLDNLGMPQPWNIVPAPPDDYDDQDDDFIDEDEDRDDEEEN